MYKKGNKNEKNVQIKLVKTREGGDIGMFITLVPKFYNKDFFFVSLITLATVI